MTMTLSDDLIRLSAPEPADLDCLYLWENDPELWPCGDNSAPLSRHQLAEYIASYDADIFSARQLRLVIRIAATGEAVGTLDLTDFNPRDRHARVGIFVAPDFRRRGIALRALSLLRPYAADTLGIHMLIALTAADNGPSRALFSAAGYVTCGRIRSYLRRGRSYCDIIVYQTLL
ncbi:MAG: GNAT family N-acetyltransferase [Muribaculaceae bacterium]|nr:GNAT family N-acetyltransferase [Muribaculaceae bacterium]